LSNEFHEAVLDASILIQTLIREKYTDTTLRLLGMLNTVYVPSLILYEIGNALVMMVRKNIITKEDAARKFKSASSIPTLRIMDPALSEAIDIAIELEITLYDASYLALAHQAGAPLVTADKELCERGKKATKVIHASEVTF